MVHFHATGWLGIDSPLWVRFVSSQFPGVPVFFVLSGALVMRSYLDRPGLLSYAARRALRIYPALWVNLAVLLAAVIISGSLAPDTGPAKLLSWAAVAFSTGGDVYANYAAGRIVGPDGFYPVFPSLVLWTIPVELGFYVSVPLLVWIGGRGRRLGPLLAGVGMASLIVMYVYQAIHAAHPDATLSKTLSVTTPTYLWYFVIGALCGVYWDKVRSIFAGRFIWWAALHVAVSCLDMLVHGTYVLDFHAITPMLPLRIVTMAAAVFSFAYTWTGLRRILLGLDLSYGIYLYHVPVILTLKGAGLLPSGWEWSAVIAGTLAIALMSWLLIEQPTLRLKAVTKAQPAKQLSANPAAPGTMP